jgi:hypothetical protein
MSQRPRRGAAASGPPPPIPLDDLFPGLSPEVLAASLARLTAAGILAENVYDPTLAEGFVRFAPAWLALIQAGLRPESDPGFAAAWDTGDPRVVRDWIETQVDARAPTGAPKPGRNPRGCRRPGPMG